MYKMDRKEGEKGWKKRQWENVDYVGEQGVNQPKKKKGLKGREIGEAVEKKVRESRRIGRGV